MTHPILMVDYKNPRELQGYADFLVKSRST